MTGRIEKTVFISYRRTNMPWALAIYQHLTSQGYDVFFDYLSITSGDFEKIILENIKGRAHFVVVLTPSALERCSEPGDWLRREIETAMDEKRNIVPLMLESFDFGSPSTVKALTGKLENLKKYNALRIPSEYFFEAMGRLREQFLNVALEAITRPMPEAAMQVTEEHQNAASEAKEVGQEELTAQEWFEKGYNHDMGGNYEEAIRCYTEAIKITPSYTVAYGNRAYAIIESGGDLEQALADLNEAIKLDPTYYIAYNNRGRVYERQGQQKKALADYNMSIKYNPNYHYPYNNRGIIYRNNGNFDRALRDCNKAIRLRPDFAEAHYNRGIVRQAKGDLNGALVDYEKAIHLKPDYGWAIASSIAVLRNLGRENEAKKQEKLARELLQKEIEYNQACFEAICGNIDKALKLLKIGLKKKQATKEWAQQDSDFENIRDDPRFKELVGE